MKTLKKDFSFSLLALIAIVAIAFLFAYQPKDAGASTPGNVVAGVATSTAVSVGPQNNVWTGFGTTTRESASNCSARIISTTGDGIMISFGTVSSTTLSQTRGHIQAASTSVAYNAETYGCGYLTVRGQNSSTTITITETR